MILVHRVLGTGLLIKVMMVLGINMFGELLDVPSFGNPSNFISVERHSTPGTTSLFLQWIRKVRWFL